MTNPTHIPAGLRELLERVSSKPKACSSIIEVNRWSIDQRLALDELRALLTAQPQASAEQSAPDAPPCWWINHGSHGQITQREDEAQTAADEGKQVVRYTAAWQRAQSAPAGEREAWMPAPDEIHQMAFEEGQPAENGDGYLFCAEEFDCFVQRLLDSLASWQRTQSAGVPEGWRLVPADPTPEMIAALGFNGDVDLAIGHAAISMDVANHYRAALAAAPAQPAALAYKDDPRSPSELSLAGCNCVRFGEGNPHWPCKIHPAQPAAQEIGELRVRLENGHKQFEFEEYSAAYALPDGSHYLCAQAPAAQDQGEVQRLREAISAALKAGRGTSGRIILEAEDEAALRAALAASTGQEVKP